MAHELKHDSRKTIVPGKFYPLGASVQEGGVNFALYSRLAQEVFLLLFDDPAGPPTDTIRLEHCSRHIWHCFVAGLRPGQLYGYKVRGAYDPGQGLRFNEHKLLIDPYARALTGKPVNRDNLLLAYAPLAPGKDESMDRRDSSPVVPKCMVMDSSFDWQGDARLDIPLPELLIYEVHLKGFTAHPSSGVRHPGTYLGFVEKIPYLQKLGINAVEFMPLQEFYIEDFLVERGLTNYWGYNTIGFFAPEYSYSTQSRPGCQVDEFKLLVRELHRAGIEVIMDVVYNHSGEGNELGPTICFRGIDNPTYYCLEGQPEEPGRHYHDVTGCGNSLNFDEPQVLRMVMDSLRYWVQEMHVDGFRFDLAAALARDVNGVVDQAGTFMDVILQDPVLSQIKLIAEPWDVGEGGYQVGKFPVGWSEWNGKYRDVVRDYWRGEGGLIGDMAYRLTGSADLYEQNGRRPHASINFVTAHDGFTLYDLVSYNERHNEANGENNQDGESHNRSWNCGAEGDTQEPEILAQRLHQRRNFLTTLLLSQGVPMLLAGDEVGRTQKGNNNTYCQDNELNWFDWDISWLPENRELLAFTHRLIQLRQRHPTFRRRHFFRGIHGEGVRDILWFNPDGREIDDDEWTHDYARCLGLYLPGDGVGDWDERGHALEDDDFLLLFNAHHEEVPFVLPVLRENPVFEVLVDTALPTGQPTGGNQHPAEEPYPVQGRSLAVLRHRRLSTLSS